MKGESIPRNLKTGEKTPESLLMKGRLVDQKVFSIEVGVKKTAQRGTRSSSREGTTGLS